MESADAQVGEEHFPEKACPGLDPGWTRFSAENAAKYENSASVTVGGRER
jgi:hypothetical protein